MAQTQMGAFDKTYHHIEAPTKQDEEWGKEHKGRILINPCDIDYTVFSDDPESPFREKEVEYLSSLLWTVKRKLDGENIRIYWDGEQALWNGKSNRFQCSANFQEYMNSTFLEEIFEEKFGRDKEVYIYGEHMGPKVQGNELGLEADELVIFDVEINGTFVGGESIKSIASYFGVKSVYDYMTDYLSADGGDAANLFECINWVANGNIPEWEGIVCSPPVNLKDHNGNRIIVKIKNRDYNKEWKK